jgi:hypothetical protein
MTQLEIRIPLDITDPRPFPDAPKPQPVMTRLQAAVSFCGITAALVLTFLCIIVPQKPMTDIAETHNLISLFPMVTAWPTYTSIPSASVS